MSTGGAAEFRGTGGLRGEASESLRSGRKSSGSMAETVLFRGRELAEGCSEVRYQEERIVAKTAVPARGAEDSALNRPVKDRLFSIEHNEGHRAGIVRPPH